MAPGKSSELSTEGSIEKRIGLHYGVTHNDWDLGRRAAATAGRHAQGQERGPSSAYQTVATSLSGFSAKRIRWFNRRAIRGGPGK